MKVLISGPDNSDCGNDVIRSRVKIEKHISKGDKKL